MIKVGYGKGTKRQTTIDNLHVINWKWYLTMNNIIYNFGDF